MTRTAARIADRLDQQIAAFASAMQGIDLRRIPRYMLKIRPSFSVPFDEPITADNVFADSIIALGKRAPAVLLYLGKNRLEFFRIVSLRTPRQVSAAVRRLARKVK